MIYLDNAATTALSPAVRDTLAREADRFYNPSSLYRGGVETRAQLQRHREEILKALGMPDGDLLFCSGATEANNLALLGAAARFRRGHILASAAEHPSVAEPLRVLAQRGFDLQLIAPGPDMAGEFLRALRGDTVLVSCMAVNNETGDIFPAGDIAAAVRRRRPDVFLHCDAVQAFGKIPFRGAPFDAVSISGHKIHAPKGIGALAIRKNARITPQLHGGGQQGGLRPGTESTLLAACLAAAAREAAATQPLRYKKAALLRGRLIAGLQEQFPGGRCSINSAGDGSPFILNFSLPGLPSEVMLHMLEERGLLLSSGSACGRGQKSAVLLAYGFPPERVGSALRAGLSGDSTEAEIDALLAALGKIHALNIQKANPHA